MLLVLTVSNLNIAGAVWVPVHADKEYSIEVKLTLPRSGKSPQNKTSGRKAHAPRFNKPVDETWWVLMGEIETGSCLLFTGVNFC